MGLTREPARRFEYALEVADYCLADLAAAETPRQVDRAARQLARALDVAMAVINAAGAGVDESMLGALQILFIRANLVLAAMSGELATPTVVQLRSEINTALTGEVAVNRGGGNAGSLLLEVAIPFLVASYDHSEIALSGAHARLACLECHLEGIYAGTWAECQACHTIPEGRGAHRRAGDGGDTARQLQPEQPVPGTLRRGMPGLPRAGKLGDDCVQSHWDRGVRIVPCGRCTGG